MSREKLKVIDYYLNNGIRKSRFLKKFQDKKSDDNHDNENYWPNTDSTIWMRSCEKEIIEPINGKTSGIIPKWVKGSLLRNGPGKLKVGEYTFEHLFDSSALLHRFYVANGKVTYQCRFVQTEVFKKNQKANKIVLTDFGTRAIPDPCQTIFQRIAAIFNPEGNLSDNSMISVIPFGDDYYALTDAPFAHRFDPETLETKNRIYVPNHVSLKNHTSHPHVMPDGSVYNVGMSVTKNGPAYSVVCYPNIDNKSESMIKNASIVATVPARWRFNPAYMHTFGITENYYIIVEQPLALALITMIKCKIKNDPFAECLKWHDNQNTLFHVVSRKTGKVEKTFEAEAFFFFHIINQFESQSGDSIIIDICCYRDAKMLDCMYVNAMKNMHKNPDYSKLFRGRPLRFILPMKNKFDYSDDVAQNEDALKIKSSAHKLEDGSVFVKPELLCNLGCETPRFNQKYLGKDYQYFYAISTDVDSEDPGAIIKVDTKTKNRLIFSEKNLYPSEPIFVPRPGAQSEDDGVILSAGVFGQEHETDVCFLVLDAKNLKELGRTTFSCPGPVPKCLHGWFASDKNQPLNIDDK